jgi:hypothetical protein
MPLSTVSHPAEARRQRAIDRKVRKLIASGRKPTGAEVVKLCPYRSLLAGPGVPLSIDSVPTTVVAVVGGLADEGFSDRMRGDIIAALLRGEVVLLLATKRKLRDYAQREIQLAMTAPAGAA